MTQTNAEVITDSINTFGCRLSTTILQFPQVVVKEFLRHRMLSVNSASQRAIPFQKNLENTKSNMWFPKEWIKGHSGMQGNEYFNESERIELDEIHQETFDFIMKQANRLEDKNVSKQIINRYIEWFGYVKLLASATEWENFFAQRADAPAEIHIQDLAYKLLDAMNASTPQLLKEGEWHLTFDKNIDVDQLLAMFPYSNLDYRQHIDSLKLKVVTARNGRTSYDNFSEKSDHAKDIDMHDNKLVKPGHWSPMEHPGRSMYEREFFNFTKTIIIPTRDVEYYEANNNSDWFDIVATVGDGSETVITEFGWCKNYRGFIPYRHLFPNENRRDSRLLSKI